MSIFELHECSSIIYDQMAVLMWQLSSRCHFTIENLLSATEDRNSHIYVALVEEIIVGCATLCIFHSPTGTKASVEDVVVLESYRGRHIGEQLLQFVINEARRFSPIELHLTSNPQRVAANKLYQKLGFMKINTNAYRMELV